MAVDFTYNFGRVKFSAALDIFSAETSSAMSTTALDESVCY